MKRIMLRVDEDLYTRIFETAHDQRLSMNAYIVGALKTTTGQDGSEVPQWVLDYYADEAGL